MPGIFVVRDGIAQYKTTLTNDNEIWQRKESGACRG